MKLKYLILTFLFLPLLACAQDYNYKDGYTFIKKAEKALKNDKIEKAENLLKKASKSNYGFCGNAWASAEGSIGILKAQVANKRKDYDQALNILDSINGCSFGANCDKRDSLKIETLFLKFGKNEVLNSFKSLKRVELNKTELHVAYSVYLAELHYNFTFGSAFILSDSDPIKQETTLYEFDKVARNYPFYKLLEE